MSIWVYNHLAKRPDHVWADNVCSFCKTKMELLHKSATNWSVRTTKLSREEQLFVCSVCGWWRAQAQQESDDHEYGLGTFANHEYRAAASLRELDLRDLTTPISEIRSYLAARYESRFTLHPRLLEETVASVFGNLGYTSEATAYSGDDGIDVILRNADETIGVQVKRYKDNIEVEQIRSLAGALVLNGFTRGMFVTTSAFQRGAPTTAAKLETRGYKIELVDAQRFYNALQIAQREMFSSFADFPIQDCFSKLQLIRTDGVPLSFEDAAGSH